ncbi:MAG: DUF2752 domain-containing protein [Polyangiales bacterium]
MTTESAYPAPPQDAPWLTRLFWLIAGLGSWAVLIVSAWLRPDPRGFGSHQQLGLPPCTFEAMTRVPCPGCGLTTSFANMAHGHVLRAFGAHLMGPLLFLLTVAVALAAPWATRRAFPVTRVLSHPGATATLSVTLAAGLITFAIRLAHRFF